MATEQWLLNLELSVTAVPNHMFFYWLKLDKKACAGNGNSKLPKTMILLAVGIVQDITTNIVQKS